MRGVRAGRDHQPRPQEERQNCCRMHMRGSRIYEKAHFQRLNTKIMKITLSEKKKGSNSLSGHRHVDNTAQHCRWGLSKDSDFTGDLADSKTTSGETFLRFFRSDAFFPRSWMCKKQTSVYHSSTESQVSLNACALFLLSQRNGLFVMFKRSCASSAQITKLSSSLRRIRRGENF